MLAKASTPPSQAGQYDEYIETWSVCDEGVARQTDGEDRLGTLFREVVLVVVRADVALVTRLGLVEGVQEDVVVLTKNELRRAPIMPPTPAMGTLNWIPCTPVMPATLQLGG